MGQYPILQKISYHSFKCLMYLYVLTSYSEVPIKRTCSHPKNLYKFPAFSPRCYCIKKPYLIPCSVNRTCSLNRNPRVLTYVSVRKLHFLELIFQWFCLEFPFDTLIFHTQNRILILSKSNIPKPELTYKGNFLVLF